jgi:hypothetical protein
MRSLTRFWGLFSLALVLSAPVMAQERGGRQSDARGASAGSAAGRGAMVSTAPATSQSSIQRSGAVASNAYFAPATRSTGGAFSVPDLRQTSFTSSRCYFDSLNYFYWVHNNFYLDRYYFSRFYRNTEPLITPKLARLTMSQPLSLSNRLLASIDQLEALIQDQQAGNQVNKDEIEAKTEEIEDLAKQIRQDQSIEFFDQRKDKNLLKGTEYKELGFEAIAQMREMALDLNHQIRDLYEQTSTATVSVDALSAPSFSSLSKGIERLSKVVSESARKGS